jgi:Amt family ammonium transporter
MRRFKFLATFGAAVAVLLGANAAFAADAAESMFTVNNTWMMVATFLVFIMHLGFATIETGLTRAKNTVNILFKNTLIPAIGLLTYAICGFNLMYPGDSWIMGKFFGFAGFGIASPEGAAGLIDYASGGYTYWTDFLFQAMFAATAATIVSGAVAERVKLHSFLIFSAVYVAVVYPVAGSWKWGKGWLDGMGFYDFAGSTLVHSVGGWAALVGVLLLGPRIGKYFNGSIRPIMPHNMPLATIGCFLLWLGWFGFNGGSVLSANPGAVSFVLVTTSLAAAAGIISSVATSWIVQKKPDLSMALNGCLAGLVGITAGADVVTVMSSVIIGLIAGVIVVLSVITLDKMRIDDPVGAISVHLVCGIWGTLAVGIFSTNPAHSLWVQFVGVVAYGIFCVLSALVIFGILKVTLGLRVSEEEEQQGLDIGEHGMEAYSGFQIFTNQ